MNNAVKSKEKSIPSEWQDFAVIKYAHSQYFASPGEVIELPYLEGDIGTEVTLEKLLLISKGKDLELGTPLIAKASLKGEIIKQKKAKNQGFKYKAKSRYRRKYGYKTLTTQILVKTIKSPKLELKYSPPKPKKTVKTKKTPSKTATKKKINKVKATPKAKTQKAPSKSSPKKPAKK